MIIFQREGGITLKHIAIVEDEILMREELSILLFRMTNMLLHTVKGMILTDMWL